ncbi:3',5'-cyclic adenosine monophosphate phosphodiesterase CpdA [Brucella endophytica]|uniref:3',5'-cyclic adenosine monophosphate phosphodiesterase CpdA n=1 Tax=Brucella endophytica TaxID=1963359 RepID=A0A916S9K1_9HYPH|nr:phosphodiesterase [Brucella endophytica]GGA87484.1 3',5'-cyclic adenosine monophosphate phosphodiesterase CpdA [Brucella endophytica]
MKIIQVSDLHLTAPGGTLSGIDPLARLEDCIADLNRHHADADLIIFSGDLTNNGEPEAYAALKDRLATLIAPYRLMMGNHDARAAFREAFPDAPGEDGFIQSFADLGGTRAILLDTLEEGHIEGRLCEARLAWLDSVLSGTPEGALIFMHHPPFSIGIPSLDKWRLADAEALRGLLSRHCNVRHIFAGHVHRFAAGSWGGIPFVTVRSTGIQSALAFTGPHKPSFEAPAYAVILGDSEDIIVHQHEFPCRDRSTT